MKANRAKENHMKATSKITNSVLLAAVLACLVAGGSGSAFAQEVNRYNDKSSDTFKNTCPGGTACADWGFSVSTDEPAALEPVVVIWSVRYFVNTADVYYAGLSVNGGACETGVYGPVNLSDLTANPTGHYLTATFQWIVLPTDDVLKAGTSNTFEVCGGGAGGVKGDEITIAQNTLSVAKY
jgi:hypothetical protein